MKTRVAPPPKLTGVFRQAQTRDNKLKLLLFSDAVYDSLTAVI